MVNLVCTEQLEGCVKLCNLMSCNLLQRTDWQIPGPYVQHSLQQLQILERHIASRAAKAVTATGWGAGRDFTFVVQLCPCQSGFLMKVL